MAHVTDTADPKGIHHHIPMCFPSPVTLDRPAVHHHQAGVGQKVKFEQVHQRILIIITGSVWPFVRSTFSMYLSSSHVCISVYLSICLYVCLSVCVCVWLSCCSKYVSSSGGCLMRLCHCACRPVDVHHHQAGVGNSGSHSGSRASIIIGRVPREPSGTNGKNSREPTRTGSRIGSLGANNTGSNGTLGNQREPIGGMRAVLSEHVGEQCNRDGSCQQNP